MIPYEESPSTSSAPPPAKKFALSIKQVPCSSAAVCDKSNTSVHGAFPTKYHSRPEQVLTRKRMAKESTSFIHIESPETSQRTTALRHPDSPTTPSNGILLEEDEENFDYDQQMAGEASEEYLDDDMEEDREDNEQLQLRPNQPAPELATPGDSGSPVPRFERGKAPQDEDLEDTLEEEAPERKTNSELLPPQPTPELTSPNASGSQKGVPERRICKMCGEDATKSKDLKMMCRQCRRKFREDMNNINTIKLCDGKCKFARKCRCCRARRYTELGWVNTESSDDDSPGPSNGRAIEEEEEDFDDYLMDAPARSLVPRQATLQLATQRDSESPELRVEGKKDPEDEDLGDTLKEDVPEGKTDSERLPPQPTPELTSSSASGSQEDVSECRICKMCGEDATKSKDLKMMCRQCRSQFKRDIKSTNKIKPCGGKCELKNRKCRYCRDRRYTELGWVNPESSDDDSPRPLYKFWICKMCGFNAIKSKDCKVMCSRCRSSFSYDMKNEKKLIHCGGTCRVKCRYCRARRYVELGWMGTWWMAKLSFARPKGISQPQPEEDPAGPSNGREMEEDEEDFDYDPREQTQELATPRASESPQLRVDEGNAPEDDDLGDTLKKDAPEVGTDSEDNDDSNTHHVQLPMKMEQQFQAGIGETPEGDDGFDDQNGSKLLSRSLVSRHPTAELATPRDSESPEPRNVPEDEGLGDTVEAGAPEGDTDSEGINGVEQAAEMKQQMADEAPEEDQNSDGQNDLVLDDSLQQKAPEDDDESEEGQDSDDVDMEDVENDSEEVTDKMEEVPAEEDSDDHSNCYMDFVESVEQNGASGSSSGNEDDQDSEGESLGVDMEVLEAPHGAENSPESIIVEGEENEEESDDEGSDDEDGMEQNGDDSEDDYYFEDDGVSEIEMLREGADKLVNEKAEGYKGLKDPRDFHPKKFALKKFKPPHLCKICEERIESRRDPLCKECRGLADYIKKGYLTDEVPRCRKKKTCQFWPHMLRACLECFMVILDELKAQNEIVSRVAEWEQEEQAIEARRTVDFYPFTRFLTRDESQKTKRFIRKRNRV